MCSAQPSRHPSFSIALVIGKQRVPIMSAMLMGLGVRQNAVEWVQLGRRSGIPPSSFVVFLVECSSAVSFSRVYSN